ncbi:MAG: NTP transferase domain-containing protein, partial [Proteobacteria bacterium]|nr:NTP transferase domain-containing protein [Pseudomonadota bacterium]
MQSSQNPALNHPGKPIVLIPARMASTRLPGKPLADIAGKPMIVQVLDRAREAAVGPVAVACAEPEIAAAVITAGGQAQLTDPMHPSGSDRIWEALLALDPDAQHDLVVNLQGDLPTLDPALIRAVLEPLRDPACDIATLVAEITDDDERDNPNVVKAVVCFADGQRIGRALYFSRAAVP